MDVFRVETANGVLDVYENTHEEFYATLQINDLFSLNTREATFSKVLNLPMSPKNEELLNIDFNTANKNEEIECQIIIDGVPVAYAAGLVVLEYDDNNIEVAFLFGNFNFFTLIPDTGISNLNFSEYNFYLDVPTMVSMFKNDEGALVCTTSWFNNSDMTLNGLSGINDFATKQDVYTSGFHLYCKTILEKLISSVGYTLDDSRVSSLEMYNNTVIPCVIDDFMRRTAQGTIYSRVQLTPRPQSVTGDIARIQYIIDLDPLGLWNGTLYQFQITQDEVYSISLSYDGDYLNVSGGGNYGRVRILVNGIIADEHEYTSTQDIAGTLTSTQALVNGDIVYAEFEGRYKNPSQQDVITLDNSSFSISTNVFPGDRNIVISEHVPYMSQRTFLTSFLSLFNGFIQADDLNKTVEISYFDEILTAPTIDYSNNIDDSRKGKAITAQPNYFQESLMSFQGADSLIRDDVNLIVNFDNEALQVAGTILDVQFTALDQTYFYAMITIFTDHFNPNVRANSGLTASSGTNTFTLASPTDFFVNDYVQVGVETKRISLVTSSTSGQVAGTWLSNHTNADWSLVSFSPAEKPIQIGYVQKSPDPLFALVDGDFQAPTETNAYKVHFPEELTMRGIYNGFYENLFEALNTPMIIEVWMYFSATELLEIDFLKPVYIKQLGHYFYINKVEQWKVNQLCRVQLVRINKLIDEDLRINRQI